MTQAKSSDIIVCASCNTKVDTPAEIASYPSGTCPKCDAQWTGKEVRTTTISVFGPNSASGATW